EVSAYVQSANKITSRHGDIRIEADSLDTNTQNRYSSSSGAVALEFGDTVRVAANYQGGGEGGSVYQFIGRDYNYTTTMGLVKLQKDDTVQVLGGYGHGGVAGARYRYNGPNDATLDLGEQDYTTSKWALVVTDLGAEDYGDGSRWLKLTTITATAVAAS